MKRLKFARDLVPLVLSRDPRARKYTTWRIDDDKDLGVGDFVKFVHVETDEVFAIAKILGVEMRTFGTLQPDDFEGHEPFESHKKMLDTYGGYYGCTVFDETPVKVVKFEILSRDKSKG